MVDTLTNLCAAKISYGIVQAGPHVQDGMPYIKSSDLGSELHLESLSRTSDAIAAKYRRSEVVPGDLVFSLRGNIGASQIVPRSIPVANLTRHDEGSSPPSMKAPVERRMRGDTRGE
jgi:type I restriction enzyme S subunit